MTASVTEGYRRAAWWRTLVPVALSRKGAIPMQATLPLTPIPSAGSPAARPARSSRNIPAGVLAGAGALLLPVAMFLPWYRDADGANVSAWGGYWFLIAEMILLFLAGTWLALGILAGR